MSRLTSVLRRNVRRALSANELEEAARGLERLKGEDPLGMDTQTLELELHLRARRLREAAALAGQLIQRFPQSGRVQYLAGRLAYVRKDYTAAAKLLEESQRLEPHWWTERALGRTHTQSGRFDEAEAILLRLADAHPVCLKDLAWLYERREDRSRARDCLERYRALRPDDTGAAAHLRRLRAASLEPEELLDEVQRLEELGQEVPANLWPPYFDAALRLGRRDSAATVLRERGPGWGAWTTRSVGWSCYRMQAHDLAFEAFRSVFSENLNDVKFLSALEATASRCGRLEELAELYLEHVREAPRLHGRIRRLERRRPS